jgi:hypothetical protein
MTRKKEKGWDTTQARLIRKRREVIMMLKRKWIKLAFYYGRRAKIIRTSKSN